MHKAHAHESLLVVTRSLQIMQTAVLRRLGDRLRGRSMEAPTEALALGEGAAPEALALGEGLAAALEEDIAAGPSGGAKA